MESASARRQSFEAAGMMLPEGLSACGAVGVTRGAMVGDQSAVQGWVGDSFLQDGLVCRHALGVQTTVLQGAGRPGSRGHLV